MDAAWLAMVLVSIAIPVAVILLVVWVLTRAQRSAEREAEERHAAQDHAEQDRPGGELERRLNDGEITRDEYERLKRDSPER